MLFAACLKGWRKMLCAIPFFFIPLNKWETPFDSIPVSYTHLTLPTTERV